MRHLLFLLCCIPCFVSAQPWRIIVQGGIIWNSKSSKPGLIEQSSPIGGMAGAGFSYQRNHWEAGLTAGYRRYAFTQSGDVVFEEDFDPLTGLVTKTTHISFVETLPAIAFAPFVNYHLGRAKPDWYFGLAPAYIRFFAKRRDDNGKIYGDLETGGNGYGLDLRAGCIYPLTKRISLFSEASGGIVDIGFGQRVQIYTASLSAGFRFGISDVKTP